MPTYTYKCEKCDLVFEHFHAMSETLEHCVACNPPASVKRVPSKTSNIKKNNNFSKQKPGKIVKEYIRDVTKEVKEEKKRLREKIT
jgi:putative FmdB family regulatory protein